LIIDSRLAAVTLQMNMVESNMVLINLLIWIYSSKIFVWRRPVYFSRLLTILIIFD